MNTPQPLSILIGALGGEGGGVLAGWLTRAAETCSFPVQRTSIPGVAQRTGATTYYVEILPKQRDGDDGEELVMALSPVPGHIDLMVASELLEAGRAVQTGLVSPGRTTLVASTHRVFTVLEKAAMSDGRFDNEALAGALERFSKRAVLFDMDAAARAAGTAISAVMLGAIAGCGAVPLPRAAFEEAIRSTGKGVDASLKGFAAGFASAGGVTHADAPPAGDVPARHVSGRAAAAIAARFSEDVGPLVAEGYLRQIDYQSRDYAELYLNRVERVYAAERAAHRGPDFPATAAVARFLALWMSYEDVIRVADLKSRAARLERLRTQVAANPDDVVRVIEYMKPGIEEWCAVLPASLAQRLRRWATKGNRHLNVGLHIRTHSLHGFLLLRALAGLRWWRPRTSRYTEEQTLIERWLGVTTEACGRDVRLAQELALCGRLIKGYGETHARGKANFLGILATLPDRGATAAAPRAETIREMREAALADPDGKKLDQSLGAHGFAPLPRKAVPIIWHKKPRAAVGR